MRLSVNFLNGIVIQQMSKQSSVFNNDDPVFVADALSNPNYSRISELFRQHNKSLVRFLATKLGSEEEAIEVAQDAYVRMLGLNDAGVESYLQAYLYRTALNLAIDRIRRRSTQARIIGILTEREHEQTSVVPSPEEIINAEQLLIELKQAINELPLNCRLAFCMVKFEHLEYAEIASKMNLSESMVRKYVSKALIHCRNRVDLNDE